MRRKFFLFLLLLFFSKAILAGEPPFYLVAGVTKLSDGAIDVKLRNPETGYVHSITIWIQLNFQINIGDKVTQQRQGGQWILVQYPGPNPGPGDNPPANPPPPNPETQPAPQTQPSDPRFQSLLQKMMKSINVCFSAEFKNYPNPSIQPNPLIVRFEGKDIIGQPARYANRTNTIEYSEEYLKIILQKFSPFEVALVLAHEAGHAVQLGFLKDHLIKYDPAKKKEWELQADQLSGMYMNCVTKGKPLTAGDEVEYLDFFNLISGDDPDHGSPQERFDAFKKGYTGGVPELQDLLK